MKTTQFKNSIIRFAEFSEKLTLTSLNEISIFKKGKGLSKEEVSKQGIYDCILYGELFTKYSNTINEIFSKTNNYYNVESTENDILVPASSTSINYFFPFVSITKKDVILGSDINIFTINNQNLNTYIALLFTKYENNKNIFRYSEGSTINHLYGRYILKYKITITTNKLEQTKIANFFTLLDKQIQLIDRKLELYELKKKYYLNNMFCDDDSNFPELRFSKYKEKLVKEKIENIVSWIRSGGTPKSDNIEFYSGNIPFISIPDMASKYLLSSKKHISELGLKNSSSYIIEKNSILLSAYATIGEVCINKIDVALPQSILGIKPNKDINIEYLYYLMQKTKSIFKKMQQTGSQPNISLEIVKNINVWVTYSYEEQTKIVNFFSFIDKNIENIKKQKEQLIKRKTYYLNNMFV